MRGQGLVAPVIIAVVAATALAFGLSRLWVYGVDGPITNPVDFRAFYCSAHVLLGGADPYRYGPLQACQAAVLGVGGLQSNDLRILFAVLPPASIAFFAPFALLPFRVATEAWLVASIFAVAYAIFTASALANASRLAVAFALIFSLGIASLVIGQVVPLVLAGMLFAAVAVRRNDGNAAVAGAAVGIIEPNLALPVWIALAIFVPDTRRGFAVLFAIMAALSLAFAPLTLEYLTSILGAHARSELYNLTAQYSLSGVLAAFGVPARLALLAGSLSYVVMLVVGIRLGSALAERFADRAFLVLTPLAAVLVGGPYIHIHQMAAAIPFALLLCGNLESARLRAYAIVAIVALAIPWQTVAEFRVFADLPATSMTAPPPVALQRPRANDPIEISNTAYIDTYAARVDRRSFAEQIVWKIPTWCALAIVLLVARRAAVSRVVRTR